MAVDGDPFADLFGTNAVTTALDGLLPTQLGLGADHFVDLFVPATVLGL
jgi:hypothetical protein